MLLEYFQMVDRIESIDLAVPQLTARSTVPAASPVFDGHFPGMPLVPGVLLIETMAQTAGLLLLARSGFSAMPFLASVDQAKLRDFVTPSAELEIVAELAHEGSGYAVAKARISANGKRAADCTMKLRTLPFADVPLGPVVMKRAEEIGLMAAVSAARGE